MPALFSNHVLSEEVVFRERLAPEVPGTCLIEPLGTVQALWINPSSSGVANGSPHGQIRWFSFRDREVPTRCPSIHLATWTLHWGTPASMQLRARAAVVCNDTDQRRYFRGAGSVDRFTTRPFHPFMFGIRPCRNRAMQILPPLLSGSRENELECPRTPLFAWESFAGLLMVPLHNREAQPSSGAELANGGLHLVLRGAGDLGDALDRDGVAHVFAMADGVGDRTCDRSAVAQIGVLGDASGPAQELSAPDEALAAGSGVDTGARGPVLANGGRYG